MKVTDFLDSTSAEYEVMEHRPTFTAQRMAAEEHVPGMYVAKPVVIRADGQFYVCVLPACCKIDFDSLRDWLGAKEVELAEETEMAELFGDCELGAEPPFGGLYGLPTIMDRSLGDDEYIVFQGGTHDSAIKMQMSEYIRIADPRILDFSYSAR